MPAWTYPCAEVLPRANGADVISLRTHCRHIWRYADSIVGANRGPSISGELCMRCRRVERKLAQARQIAGQVGGDLHVFIVAMRAISSGRRQIGQLAQARAADRRCGPPG